MPTGQSYNVLATAAEEPKYAVLFEEYALNPASVATLTNPAAAGGGFLIPGTVLQFGLNGTFAGVGANPPLGFGQTYPGGDSGSSGQTGNTTFPYNWTVQYVDVAATTTTTYLAGICLGIGGPGSYALPQNLTTPANTAVSSTQAFQTVMVGKRGVMQVLIDNNSTAGNTLICSTTHTGQAHDTGGTTRTYGTTIGISLQTVSLTSSVPQLCWAYINMP